MFVLQYVWETRHHVFFNPHISISVFFVFSTLMNLIEGQIIKDVWTIGSGSTVAEDLE
jgi:hypothetical protein